MVPTSGLKGALPRKDSAGNMTGLNKTATTATAMSQRCDSIAVKTTLFAVCVRSRTWQLLLGQGQEQEREEREQTMTSRDFVIVDTPTPLL